MLANRNCVSHVRIPIPFSVYPMTALTLELGVEVAYVLEGTIEYQIDGKPPVILKTGDALFIPNGAVHTARNVGSGKASELATYIVE